MDDNTTEPGDLQCNRREFICSAAVAGAGLMITVPGWAQEQTEVPDKAEELAVGIIGPGSQGKFLLTKALKIPGIRFVAACDVWPYHREITAKLLKKYDQLVNTYEDYREMLDQEKHLDAVIVATPDWVHAEHTNACLRAGKHVYCEKEMSNTIAGARSMVETARETGKLLQIGHQRRSNPRYWHALTLIEKDKILGRVTHAFGQWNRPQLYELGWPQGREVDPETLKRHGYENMDQFRNWRWYRKYSGGPLADLGSHQIDVFNWFLKTTPKAVIGSGGLDYYTEQEGRDWYDNVMTIYEYDTKAGPVRCFYQILNTTSNGGFFETFMGDEGTLVVSEDSRKGYFFREQQAKKREWEDEAEKIETMDRDAIELKIGETLTPEGQKTPEAQRMLELAAKPPHQLHLESFFDAIRNGTPLSCPSELAFEVCVSVLRANEAIDAGDRVEFQPDEFKA
ncbi:MAG: Gfo/Idh/MocA family oxidoreductase [Phycisphaerae bacterium]|nr:Gfo/Idh/MocA family oxidoreductase [Phycisphaerae bacterium]